MRAFVIYESLYGNTQAVAEAIAAGLREHGEADLIAVADAQSLDLADADLLVVGGPTHIHGMSSKLSRKGALDDAKKHADGRPEPDVEGPPLRDWLADVGRAEGMRAAAFDTRIGKPKLVTGSAARGIAKRLDHHGFDVIGEESFVVDDSAGPLHEGELDRARAWARDLAAAF
jgi:hypothetical protein